MADEQQLVENAKSGSIEAYEELVLLYSKKIYNYCYGMTSSKENAEDLTQDVFIKVYKHISKFKKESQFSTWIYKIAHNACMDFFRKNKTSTASLIWINSEGEEEISEIPSEEKSLDEIVIAAEQREMVREAIGRLKPEYKSVVILRELRDMSYDEISKVLNMPLGTVKSYISRARAELKAELSREIVKDGRNYGL